MQYKWVNEKDISADEKMKRDSTDSFSQSIIILAPEARNIRYKMERYKLFAKGSGRRQEI